jgi:hypothetical protein
MSERNLAKWSFEGISNDDKGKLIALAGQVKRGSVGYIKAALELGEVLAVAQEILADHKGGTFGLWLEEECGLSKTTAYRYLAVFNFNTHLVGGLPAPGQLSIEAMEVLGSSKAPPEAVEHALELITRGTPITSKLAKVIVEEHQREPVPQKPAQAVAAINPKSRKAASNAVYTLMRALAVLGIDDEFDAALSQILERMEQL